MNLKPFNFLLMNSNYSNVVAVDSSGNCTHSVKHVQYIPVMNSDYNIIVVLDGKDEYVQCNEFGHSLNGIYTLMLSYKTCTPIDWSKLPPETMVLVPGLDEDNPVGMLFNTTETAVIVTRSGILFQYPTAQIITNPRFISWNPESRHFCPVPDGILIDVITRTGQQISSIKGSDSRISWACSIHAPCDEGVIAYRIVGVDEGFSPYFKNQTFN